MIPVLYRPDNGSGLYPNDYDYYRYFRDHLNSNGEGALCDCFSCKVKEERNGIYELELDYAANGIHADEIKPGDFIKAKPNFTDDPQLFQIYKVGKNINGHFTVNAQHISYLLSGKVITSGSANNIVSAVSLLNSCAGSFTLSTTKNTQGSFKITEPSSVRSWFGGKEGSLLDVYGTGEWYYNNYNATLRLNRGEDRGVQIRYGKNLTELSQEIDMSNLVSGIIPFYKDSEGRVTVGTEVSTGLTAYYKNVTAVDFSENIDPGSETPIATQLATLATQYVSSHNFTSVLSNITLDFVQLQSLAERIDLCDTVHIYFEPLGIEASMKCISTTWDVLEERYVETEFGDPRSSVTSTIQTASTTAANAQNTANNAQNTANNAQNSANSAQSTADNAQSTADNANTTAQTAYGIAGEKKRVFIDTPVPPYDVGDLWVNGSDIYYCVVPKTETITGEAYDSTYQGVEFNTPIAAPLLECIIPSMQLARQVMNTVNITVANEDGIQETYTSQFSVPSQYTGRVVTYNVLEGIITVNNEVSIEVDPITITTLEGYNHIDGPGQYISVEYLVEGFQLSDWNLATDYVSESRLEDAIAVSTEVITGATGGNVILHDSNGDGKPDEILIMDTEDVATALKIWRWNAGGLGYSSTGYNGPFTPAIDSQGRIIANMITTGSLDALKVTVEHLTASMFEGGKISLGGINNQSGVLELKDETGVVIGELTKDGLKFYGAGPVGQRPYVVLNNTDGFKGYDAFGNPLFWVTRDEFNMKKCVATDEINACGMLKMLPMTIESGGTVVNRGLAFIPIV